MSLFGSTATYDPAQVYVTIGASNGVGGQVISGFAPETFVEARYNNNRIKIIQGSEGESTRTMSLDRSGAIRILLLSNSDSNTTLGSYARADRLTGGSGIFDIQIADYTGNLVAHGAKGWIEEIPGLVASGSGVKVREWTIAVQELELIDTPATTLLAELEGALLGLAAGAQNLFKGADSAVGKFITGF